MTITTAQYEELKSVEQTVSRLERQAESIVPLLQNEFESGNEKEADRLEGLINEAYSQADKLIRAQAKSMRMTGADILSLMNNLENAKKYVA